MIQTRRIISLLLLYIYSYHCAAKELAQLQLATIYQPPTNISEYWISEKLDGVRGYWTGKHLLTRQGNVIHAPSWFTRGWPNIAFEGEIWSQRGRFENISGCVRRKVPENQCWQKLSLMVFDLPFAQEVFTDRIQQINQLVTTTASPHLKAVNQFKINSLSQLHSHLDQVVENGGEGLMLHHQDAFYQKGRSKSIMKLKKHQDAEAIVVAHIEGNGKFRGMLGALVVEMPDKKQFKIGTGFSHKERKNPPPIGATITYKYIGKTQLGVPRFASFLRIRQR